MNKIFLDANIILDFLDAHRKFCNCVIEIMTSKEFVEKLKQ